MYDYLDKWYHVIWKHKTDASASTQRLSFRLIDTPVTELWLETVRETIADPNFKVFYNQMATFFPSLDKIQQTWNLMYQGVQETNSKQWVDVDYISMPEHFDPNNNPQALLNQLHYEFHRLEETVAIQKWRIINGSYDPLQIVNVSIHKLEQMVALFRGVDNIGRKADISLMSSFFIHRTDPKLGSVISTRTIPEHFYQYWNHDDAFGVLLLGYHTIGKNLFHCYRDNDVELVQRGMVRPQIILGTEAQLVFSKLPPENCAGQQAQYLREMHQWVKNNHLESFVDLNDPKHNLGQQPMLGKIQTNINRQEISDLFEHYQIETVELEE